MTHQVNRCAEAILIRQMNRCQEVTLTHQMNPCEERTLTHQQSRQESASPERDLLSQGRWFQLACM